MALVPEAPVNLIARLPTYIGRKEKSPTADLSS